MVESTIGHPRSSSDISADISAVLHGIFFRNNLTGPLVDLPAANDSSPILTDVLDVTEQSANHATMSTLTREELDAKLETIEVRMDGRVASIEAKIDGFMARMDDRTGRMEADLSATRSEFKSLKTTIIITAIASVLGLFGANVGMVQTMLAAFESGKNSTVGQAELKRQSEETAALLKQMQDQMRAAQPAK